MRNKKINVLSYDVPFHRKTYDTLNLLKALGYTNVSVMAFPLHYEKHQHSLIAHRPGDFLQISEIPCTKMQCRNFSYEYRRVTLKENDFLKRCESDGGEGGGYSLYVERESFLKNS